MENKYFAELARRLRAAGITADHPEKNRLTVLLNNQPVLSVSAGSDVFLLPAGSNQPEAGELYHKVAQTADEVYAYVEAVQTAPLLHASGLSEKFHLLADFGGAVLAGRELENGWGYQFVTWIWDHDRAGVSHGHYVWAEQGQGEAYWMDKWQAVLELEDCHRLDQALDFSQNLQHFAFIPRGVELGRFGFELAVKSGIIDRDSFLAKCFDGKSYAEWYIQKHGLSATDHGYVAWNGGELRYEYSDLGGSPMTAQTM